MSWANPGILIALLLPVAAAWQARRMQRNSTPLWPALSRVSVSADYGVRVAPPPKSFAPYLITAAVALGIIALARPQWGEQPELSFSQRLEVVIALDLSRSMWAPDMPNHTTRLRAAKATIERLLDAMRGENVGLVVFAGTSFVQVPMSPDYQIIREFLPSLDPNYMPVGGSDYDRMLASAIEGFGQTNDRDRYLIVLSDGETTGRGFEPRISELLRRNIHVIGIGFGTEQGANIPDQKGGQLFDKRKILVISRLTPGTLQSLATSTEGAYLAATTLTDDSAVRKMVRSTVESGRAGRVRNANISIGVERFQWFLVPAVLLGLISLTREFRRHTPSRPVHPATTIASAPIYPTHGTDAQSPADGASKSVVPVVGIMLAVFLCMLNTSHVQAHHNAEAGFEVKEVVTYDPAQRVRAIASHMGRFGYDPFDLQLLVKAAIRFGANERAAGRLPLQGVMHDAVDAVHLGRSLAPKQAQWNQYEAEINALLAPLPLKAKDDDDADRSDSDDDDDDEQNYRPVPLRKAKDKEGKDLFGKNTKSRSEFALGDLSGDETFAPQEPHGSRRRPPKPPQSTAPTPSTHAADDPTMNEARRNFAIVVKADSPGRVHQLLNGDVKKLAVDQEW